MGLQPNFSNNMSLLRSFVEIEKQKMCLLGSFFKWMDLLMNSWHRGSTDRQFIDCCGSIGVVLEAAMPDESTFEPD